MVWRDAPVLFVFSAYEERRCVPVFSGLVERRNPVRRSPPDTTATIDATDASNAAIVDIATPDRTAKAGAVILIIAVREISRFGGTEYGRMTAQVLI